MDKNQKDFSGKWFFSFLTHSEILQLMQNLKAVIIIIVLHASRKPIANIFEKNKYFS